MLLNSKIKKVIIVHEVTITYKETKFSFFVETLRNNEIQKIIINHDYFLKRKTRKLFMQEIRKHFEK